jgi:acyl-coenzyme A synthetase/AMP-(fatty) acid ligase
MQRSDVLFVRGAESVDRRRSEERTAHWQDVIASHRRVLAHGVDVFELNALLLASRARGKLLIVASSDVGDVVWRERCVELHAVDVVVTADGWASVACANPASSEAGLGVFTSGTTGAPKLARHDWHSIDAVAKFVRPELAGRRWFMAYAPTSFAGFQVFFAAHDSGGTIVYPSSTLPETCHAIVDCGVEVLSATPSFWRSLVAGWPRDLAMPRLLQATLGGEVVTQDVIDLVERHFCPVGLTHVYASTEAGSAISVSDRRAGFPAAWLTEDRVPGLRVRDGILEILSERAMKGYMGAEPNVGWYRTPDRVIVEGDRVKFLGRDDGIINAGGVKVSPEWVEEKINSLPGVHDSHVYARANPITGSLVVADVVTQPPEMYTAAQLRDLLFALLPPTHIPHMIRFVDRTEVTSSGKKRR